MDGVKWGWFSCSVSGWLGRFGCGGGLVNLEEWGRKKRGEKNKKKKKKEWRKKNQGNQCCDVVTTHGVYFQVIAIIYSLISWKGKKREKGGEKKF